MCCLAHGDLDWIFPEPDTGLDHCLRILLLCFRARTSVHLPMSSTSYFFTQIPYKVPEGESQGRDESRAVHADIREVVPHRGEPQGIRGRLLRPLAAKRAEGPHGLQGKAQITQQPPQVRATSHSFFSRRISWWPWT